MRDERNEAELDALMARLADGDRTAFDPLFQSLHPRALRFARTRLAAACATDAAQSTMLKLFTHASEFQAGRPVLPWFYAIASNEVRALVRGRAVSEARSADASHAAVLSAGDDPERELVDRELGAALERAIESLDERSAEAIRAVLGRADRPVADAATFRKRVSRAYAQLRLLLGESHGR